MAGSSLLGTALYKASWSGGDGLLQQFELFQRCWWALLPIFQLDVIEQLAPSHLWKKVR